MSEDTKKCTLDSDSQYADFAAEIFTLLSDATRVRIILALRDTEKSVNELADEVGKSPTVVFQHLAKLRWGKIVVSRQDGNRAFYSLVDEQARQLFAQAIFQAPHVVSGAPAHHQKADGTIVTESAPSRENH